MFRPTVNRSTRTAAVAGLAGLLLFGGVALSATAPAQALSCSACDGTGPDPAPSPTSSTTTTTAPSSTGTWYVDANTVKVVSGQEQSWISNGDEFYVAQLAFRSKPGVAGSTQTWYQGGLTEMSGLTNGKTYTIPNSMGRVAFSNVTLRSLSQIQAGHRPEVLGTLSVVFESDATPFSMINSKMSSLATVLKTEIAKVVEPLTFANLADTSTISSRLATAANNVRSAAMPSTLDALGFWLASLSDPDDLIAFKANVFVAVDSTLSGQIDAGLGNAIPTSLGVGGSLKSRGYTQRFSGDGATYDVAYAVSR
jgi:hypothetical protein